MKYWNYWFYLNFILLSVAIFRVVTHYSFPSLTLPVLFGFIGFLFFLFNWTRNAFFATIRSVPDRKIKIKLANLSKKVMPYHRWTGTIALILVLFHAIFVIHSYDFSIYHGKMMIGLLALINLILLVSVGWIRLIRKDGKLRFLHLRLGYLQFILIALHLVL